MALTTTSRTSTARWCGLGKRHGQVYERNQCLNAPQERNQCLNAPQANPPARNLADMGWVAPRTLRPQPDGELLGRRMSSTGRRRAAPPVTVLGIDETHRGKSKWGNLIILRAESTPPRSR